MMPGMGNDEFSDELAEINLSEDEIDAMFATGEPVEVITFAPNYAFVMELDVQTSVGVSEPVGALTALGATVVAPRAHPVHAA